MIMIGPVGLFLIVLASLAIGCCIGMVVMAFCRISAEESRVEERQENAQAS